MAIFLLKFGILLTDYESELYDLNKKVFHNGPLFHRWLPNGESDAIELDTGDENADLKIWFERKGFVENGFIKYHYERREIDEALIPKQGILEAGHLFGILKINKLSPGKIKPIRTNDIGHADYETIGKRAAKLIYGPVSRFIKTLRTNYGQYWLKDIEKWDSRTSSIGYYFSGIIQSKCSLDSGKTWSEFRPTKAQHKETVAASIPLYNEYLSAGDWEELRTIGKSGYEPSPATEILARAYKLLKQERFKQALIEGVTALEIAMNEFVRNSLGNNKDLLNQVQSFWNVPLPSQVLILGAIASGGPIQNLESAVQAIKDRNKVVHEGWIPPDSTKENISKLLKVVAAFLPQQLKFKFPNHDTKNNEIKAQDEWGKKGPKKMSFAWKIHWVPNLLRDE